MEYKGTKGKWDYKYDNCDLRPTEWYNIQSDKGDVLRRDFNESDFELEEMRANALLISKAPEMLGMIKLLTDRLEENDLGNLDAVRRAKELIKQATEL